MLEIFRDHKFNTKSLELMEICNAVIEDYRGQGLSLTVRQLYYRLVAGGHIENSMKTYKKVVNLLNKARLSGRMSWRAIEDRTRNLKSPSYWDAPEDIMESCINSFKLDKWETQPTQIEVWVEKEALVGVVGQICDKLEIPFFACRGYVSQSEQWRAAKRIQRRDEELGQGTVILHLGDHDPSGIDMTRDNLDRLQELSYNANLQVDRIALNMDQVRKYNPPPNPAKLTDTRIGSYIQKYGESSWELDALEPIVMQNLIEDRYNEIVDHDEWEAMLHLQNKQIKKLEKAKDFVINLNLEDE